jgi:hypothetical protein
MTDRELLEAAARAAGIDGEYRTEHLCINGDWLDVTAIHTEDEWWGWDPLEDDGDALRLAVKLKLRVSPGDEKAYVDWWEGITLCDLQEPNNSDPYAATRRAIVRAAAVMDKEKA